MSNKVTFLLFCCHHVCFQGFLFSYFHFSIQHLSGDGWALLLFQEATTAESESAACIGIQR